MFENFYKTFCDTIIAQFKIPRKGVTMILLVLSTIAIIINKCVFHYSIAAKGSLLLQLIYAIWIFSFMSIPVKAYNEYCDKKDAEKALEEEKEKYEEKLNKYFEAFDYCDYFEKEVLAKFYLNQLTSCYAKSEEITTIQDMKIKGFDFISYNDTGLMSRSMIVSMYGLKLISKYFDKKKPEFFTLLNNLNPKEIKLIKDFVINDEEQIELYKNEIKTAKSIISKFENANFAHIYIDTNGFFTISTLYLAYLTQYFEEKEANFSLST